MGWTILLVGFLIGIFSGVLSGAFGIGASSIKIVLLRVLLGVEADIAIATALPLSIPAALSGSAVYNEKHMIKYRTALMCGVSGAAFAVLGAFATGYVPGEILMLLVALVLLVSAWLAFDDIRKEKKGKKERKQSEEEKAGYSVFAGAVAGFSSGFLGIGGGIVLVPLLARLRRIPYRKAVPCSLLVMLIYIVPASITHFGLGNVDVPLLLSMGVGSAVGALFGARAAVEVEKGGVKKWFVRTLMLFGAVLLSYEIWMILKG